MDIQLKLERENEKLTVLLTKEEEIRQKIKDSKNRIQQYQDMLKKQAYDELQKLLQKKGMSMDEAMQMLADSRKNLS